MILSIIMQCDFIMVQIVVCRGDDLVGGNPTMNTPRLRRGEEIASSSSLFFTCSDIHI